MINYQLPQKSNSFGKIYCNSLWYSLLFPNRFYFNTFLFTLVNTIIKSTNSVNGQCVPGPRHCSALTPYPIAPQAGFCWYSMFVLNLQLSRMKMENRAQMEGHSLPCQLSKDLKWSQAKEWIFFTLIKD